MDFPAILEANKQRLYRFCRLYATTREDREDLFQEIVFNLWKSLPSFQGGASLETWIYRVALNVSMRFSLKTRQKRERFGGLDGIEFVAGGEKSTTEQLENEEQIKQLYACIRVLPEIERSIITLFLEEMSHKEIAAIVGISENYVAVKIARIKPKLLTCLQSHE